VAKTFDLVFATGAILLLYVVALSILREKRYAFVSALVFVFDCWFLRWTGSGMETSLGVLLMLLSLFYVYRNEYPLAALVCALLTLVRPEGILLLFIVQVDNLLNSTNRSASARSILRSSVLYALVVVPWLVFSFLHFGTAIPNTFAAKTSSGFLWHEYVFTAMSVVNILGSTQAPFVLTSVLGFALVWKREGWKGTRLILIPLLWIVLLPVSYIVFKVHVVSRYLLLISPLIIVLGVWGIKTLGETWELADRTLVRILVAVALVTVGINQYLYRSAVVPHMKGFVEGMNTCLKPIAFWLREHTPEKATVLTPDVGLVGYVSGRVIFDTAGLVSPAVKRAFAGVTYDEGMRQQQYKAVIHPQFVLDRGERPERLASKTLQPVMSNIFPSLGVTQAQPVYYTLYRVVE
jgi:hypothetical protein